MDSFNDLSSAAALLATRRSGKARDLVAPGPDAAQMEQILGSAARVPDHGKLAPWRFITVADDRRDALADVLESAYRAEHPGLSDAATLAPVRAFALQAPALVIVLSAPIPGHKVPLWEQELSAGAAAMQLLNACHALGFAGNWLTEWATYSDAVHAALAQPGERIVGFVFIGTSSRPLDERPRPVLADVVRSF